MCKVTPISGKNDNNSRFLQVFFDFWAGRGSAASARGERLSLRCVSSAVGDRANRANGANGANGHSAA